MYHTSGLGNLVDCYESVLTSLEALGGEDIPEEAVLLQEAFYKTLITSPATSVNDCATKLRFLGRHFEGGEVPACDVDRVSSELSSLTACTPCRMAISA